MEYDVFICHASEDKKDFVQPLANALVKKNLKVWYDEFELALGDSLREKIDYGLANSRYGVVVLSKAFFEKKWPKEELDGLVARQTSEGKKVILPIWHKVNYEDVKKFSPILAGKLAARSEEGIESVVAQILDVCREIKTPKSVSVFQDKEKYSLREECLDIIRQDDKIAWIKLITAHTELIPEQLKKWKEDKGDSAAPKGGKVWEDALLDAANICLPGFIPIFASIEAGKQEYWSKSLGITRRLAILYDEMGGGSKWAINIGSHMLYVVGSLGMSIAVGLKFLELVDSWMTIKMPSKSGQSESLWIEVHEAHSSPPGIKGSIDEPFRFLSHVCKSELIKVFFPNPERMTKNLLLSNLIASMIEFRFCCRDINSISGRYTSRISDLASEKYVSFDIPPLWCLMKPEEFRAWTLELFGDSQGVINFVFPKRSAISDKFWQYWEIWHKACSRHWSHIAFQNSRYDLLDMRWLKLPGQPDWKDNSS